MKCAEITDKVIEAIESGKYDHIRLNYLNGDWCKFTCETHWCIQRSLLFYGRYGFAAWSSGERYLSTIFF